MPRLPLLLSEFGFGQIQTSHKSTPSGDVAVTIVEADPRGERAGLRLAWVELKLTRPVMDVRPVLRFGDSFGILEGAISPSAVAVVNGGFYGYDSKGAHIPLGLVVAGGTIHNRKASWKGGGILYQDESRRLHVVSPSALANLKGVASAIQSKPVLVQDGKLDIWSDDGDRYNRSAISLTSKGEVIIVGAFQSFGRAMAMKEFARVVTATKSSSGAPVQVALAMDGGPGAQIYVPSLKLHFGDPGKNFVPNLVQFVP